MGEPVGEAERAEQGFGPLPGRRLGRAADQLRDDHILDRGEIGEQMVELVDEAEPLAPRPRAAGLVEIGGLLAPDPDRALEAALEQPHRLQQGGLARARGAEQSDDLALGDGEIDPAQHVDDDARLLEAALEARNLQHLIHSAAPEPDRCSPPSTPDRA